MPKFRKLPVVIEADQFTLGHRKGTDFLPRGVLYDTARDQHYLMTLEGPAWLIVDNWIITGVRGEQYICDDRIFRQTYEEAL